MSRKESKRYGVFYGFASYLSAEINMEPQMLSDFLRICFLLDLLAEAQDFCKCA